MSNESKKRYKIDEQQILISNGNVKSVKDATREELEQALCQEIYLLESTLEHRQREAMLLERFEWGP